MRSEAGEKVRKKNKEKQRKRERKRKKQLERKREREREIRDEQGVIKVASHKTARLKDEKKEK